MSPSPNVPHQDYVMKLANQLYSFLEGESCRLFVAPLDVFLEAEEAGDEGDTVRISAVNGIFMNGQESGSTGLSSRIPVRCFNTFLRVTALCPLLNTAVERWWRVR